MKENSWRDADVARGERLARKVCEALDIRHPLECPIQPLEAEAIGLRAEAEGGGFALLGALRALGLSRRPLDATRMKSWARRMTGLKDFGDPFFEEPLRRLTQEQADYIGVPVEGPYKAEYYRY